MSARDADAAGARIIDGKAVADAVIERAKAQLAELDGAPVVLATVMVGDHAPSRLYVNLKHKRATAAGLVPRLVSLPQDTTQAALEDAVGELVRDPEVHGILLQLPLPKGLDAAAIIDMLPPEKDVDGLTRGNLGALLRGEEGHAPCTPLGVIEILKHYGIETAGKRAVVVGRSYLVGLPQMVLLSRRGIDATVTLCHSKTPDLAGVCRQADILVAATGRAEMIDETFVKPGAAVIDVGVSDTPDGIRGDVHFERVRRVAGALTPMPGGTGPATVACLIANTVRGAARAARGPQDS